jgi:hypothetical protein
MLAEFLTTLLEDLDDLAELTLPEVTKHFDEVIKTVNGDYHEEGDNSSIDTPSQSRELSRPSTSNLPSNSTSAPIERHSGLHPNTQESPADTSPERSSKKDPTTPYPDDDNQEKRLAKSDTKQLYTVPNTRPNNSTMAVPRYSPFPASSMLINQGTITTPLKDGEFLGMQLNGELKLNSDERGKDINVQGADARVVRQNRSLSETKTFSAERLVALPSQSRTPLTIDSTTLSTYRDLIRSLLWQPGGGANQLESGVAKALAAALSNETTSRVLEILSETNSASLQDGAHNLASIRDHIKTPGVPFDLAKKSGETIPRTEAEAQHNIQRSIKKGGDDSLITLSHSTPPRDFVQPSLNNSTPLGLTLKGFVGTQAHASRLSVGVLSDPALLAALQGAALKRTYSDIPKLKKRESLRRRLSEESKEDSEQLNDTSQESTGLSLLRAFLEQRAELPRR